MRWPRPGDLVDFEGRSGKVNAVSDGVVDLYLHGGPGGMSEEYIEVDADRFIFAYHEKKKRYVIYSEEDVLFVEPWHIHGRRLFDLAWKDKHPIARPLMHADKRKLLELLALQLPKEDPRLTKLAEWIRKWES